MTCPHSQKVAKLTSFFSGVKGEENGKGHDNSGGMVV